MKEIMLRLDEATANDLWNALYAIGEHIAAGAPIHQLPSETNDRLAAVMAEIDHQLGRMTIAEAMGAALERKNRSV
jgi:hypothetical protein